MTSPLYISNNTHVIATIYRHDRLPLALEGEIGATTPTGPTIIGAQTNKSLGGAGTWSLDLKSNGEDLRGEISADDWIVIFWTRNGVPLFGTIGLVDTLARSTRSNGGVTVTDWRVAGRDFAKIIDKTVVWFNDYADFETNVGGKIMGRRFNYIPGGTPDAVVENIVDAFLGGDGLLGGAWTRPIGLDNVFSNFFVDGLRVHVRDGSGVIREGFVGKNAPGTAPSLRGELFDETSLFQPQPGTTMAQLLTEWSNPLLNELIFDVAVDGDSVPEAPLPTLFIRERPFVSAILGLDSPWFKIPSFAISRHDIVTSDVGLNDDERMNLFLLYASNVGQTMMDQYALNLPAYDRQECARHGIRKREDDTRFSGVGARNGIPDAWNVEVGTWHSLLVSWYAMNHRYFSGSMSLRYLVPEIRVGTRLVVGEDDEANREQFYVENVGQSWRFPQGGSTTLGLTRGWRGSDGNLVDNVVAAAAQFQRNDINPPVVPARLARRPGVEDDIAP